MSHTATNDPRPRFSYKHYYRIADAINEWIRDSTDIPPSCAAYLIQRFCVMFEADNPRFSREKFVARCTRIEAPK